MKNEQIIAGLNKVLTGINEVIEALSNVEGSTPEISKDAAGTPKSVKTKSEAKREKAQEEATLETSGCPYTEEEMLAMKYNELKKNVAALGVDCKGTRNEIIARALALGEADGAEPEKEEVKEEAKTAKAPGKKVGLKNTKKEEEPEEDGIPQEYIEKATEVVKNNSLADVKTVLQSVGITYKGRKAEGAIPLLAEALQKGLIDLEGEDSEEETEGDEIDPATWFSDFDVNGLNNPEEMTDERAEAVTALVEEILQGIDEGKITESDILQYIDQFASEEEQEILSNNGEDEMAVVALYIEMQKHNVDDEGEVNEPGSPYSVGDENLCCGRVLGYDKKLKRFICEVCGNTYEEE